MLRLQRYLLGELLTAFVLVLLIITGIFLAGSLLQILQKYHEISVFAVLRSIPLFLALALPVTIPLSFLMACLLSYGRFSDDNEFLAFQMGGLSPWHAVAPGICAAVVISTATLYLNTDVNPTMTSAKKEILRSQVRELVARMRDPSRTNIHIEDMEMSWDGRDGEWFKDVYLTWTSTEQEKDGAPKVKKVNRVMASRATVKLSEGRDTSLVVTLADERMVAGSGSALTTMTAKVIPVIMDLDDESSLNSTKGRDEMHEAELYYRMVRLEPTLGRDRQKAEWRAWRGFAGEYWHRIALGLCPLAFALLGVPLGLIVRRGSRSQALVLALFVALPVYFPLLLLGDNLARAGTLPPALATNLGNLLLGIVGVVLTLRLVTR